ncbi:MAG: hypothetical protein ABMA15_29065, partial [Vicinamibacterales bacterium]
MTQHNPAIKSPGDRDEQLEQWLRDGWTPQGEQTELCLDAETAAAWADGVLVGAALEQAQVHAATCARCQTLLATLVSTADAARSTAVVEAGSPWRRWFTWVVPLTAAATAVVALAVWVRTPQPAEPSSARGASTAVVRAPEVPAPQVDARVLPVVPAPSSAVDAAGQTSSGLLRARPDASNTVQAAKAQSLDALRAEPSKDAREARPQSLDEAAGQNALGKTTGALSDADVAQKAEPAAPAAAAPAPAAPPLPPAPAARAAGGASAPAESKATDAGPALFRSIAPVQERVGWTTVVAPDRVAQWRFDGSQVQRSTDRGVTWTAVDQSQASQIRAGSAPTSSVCWLVGGGGLVLLTTDGASWNRSPLPAAVDLVSVVHRRANRVGHGHRWATV